MCTVVTRAESSRKEKTLRSTCPEVSIVETVVCAVPYLRPDNSKHIFHHPHLENTYINTYGDEFTMHGWLIHSNPHHSFQPIGQPPRTDAILFHLSRLNPASLLREIRSTWTVPVTPHVIILYPTSSFIDLNLMDYSLDVLWPLLGKYFPLAPLETQRYL